MANECESDRFYHGPKTRVLFLGEISSAAELVTKVKAAHERAVERRAARSHAQTLTEQRRRRFGLLQQGYSRHDTPSGRK